MRLQWGSIVVDCVDALMEARFWSEA